jgi:uncharacterized protein (TIGR00730 family)
MDLKKVCVFCASSPKINEVYFRDAAVLGRLLAENHIEINYGGGAVGLMGKLADAIMENGGIINGIIPLFMKEMAWAHEKVPNLMLVKDMHERKRLMISGTDAVIALPGGIGTLEELSEVITLKQLGQYLKPIIILNTNGFYDEFIAFLSRMISENFMRHIHKEIWIVVNSPHEVLPAIMNAPPWDESAIMNAAVV